MDGTMPELATNGQSALVLSQEIDGYVRWEHVTVPQCAMAKDYSAEDMLFALLTPTAAMKAAP